MGRRRMTPYWACVRRYALDKGINNFQAQLIVEEFWPGLNQQQRQPWIELARQWNAEARTVTPPPNNPLNRIRDRLLQRNQNPLDGEFDLVVPEGQALIRPQADQPPAENVPRREEVQEPIYISEDEIIIIESDTDSQEDDDDDEEEEQHRLALLHRQQVIVNGSPRRYYDSSEDEEEE